MGRPPGFPIDYRLAENIHPPTREYKGQLARQERWTTCPVFNLVSF
jgi:hypothetical protein